MMLAHPLLLKQDNQFPCQHASFCSQIRENSIYAGIIRAKLPYFSQKWRNNYGLGLHPVKNQKNASFCCLWCRCFCLFCRENTGEKSEKICFIKVNTALLRDNRSLPGECP